MVWSFTDSKTRGRKLSYYDDASADMSGIEELNFSKPINDGSVMAYADDEFEVTDIFE